MQRILLVTLVAFLGGWAASPAHAQPDVIVGDLQDLQSWGSDGDIYAYSVGTTSCNIGDEVLDWYATTPAHPVIGQQLYRYKDGILEQVGFSWLKHGFCALSLDLCSPCSDTNCDTLGVGCSDPYTASRNGSQGNLGPRSDVDAWVGEFPYPPTPLPAAASLIDRRIQVNVQHVDPVVNPDSRYFVEGHYVTNDDALAGNGENNVSYREIAINSSPAFYRMEFIPGEETIRELPAIFAWAVLDPTVDVDELRVPGEGLFYLATRVSDNMDGTWHYEYAIYNMNSDISGRTFQIPLNPLVNISNAEFFGVPYHSGEPYSTTPWTFSISTQGLEWSTETISQNPNANALRWSRMFNFRFDADAPPENGTVSMGLYKQAGALSVSTDVPGDPQVPVPESLSCTSDGVGALIAWENPFAYTSLDVYREGNVIATLPGDATSFFDPSVTPGSSYGYAVVGFDGPNPSGGIACTVDVPLPVEFVRGDPNQDGGFDVSDVVFYLASRFVPGSPQPECEDSVDANDDGAADISDAVFMLYALFLPGADPIPGPTGTCGVDSTPDSLECPSFGLCP